MPVKPTDSPQWATNHTPDPAGLKSDPTNENVPPNISKQQDGFEHEETVPYNWLNWLFYITFLWVEWLNHFNENHIHNGGAGDLSSPKVNLTNHIAWGDHGEYEVTVDSSGQHRVHHRAVVSAITISQSDFAIRSVYRIGQTSGVEIDIDDESGLDGARCLRVEGVGAQIAGVSTQAYRVDRSNPPGGNFSILFPGDSSLYKGNLVKHRGTFNFTEGSGSLTNSSVTAYNISGNFVTSGAPSGTFVMNAISANVSGTVTHSISSVDGTVFDSSLTYDSANNRLILTVKYWNGSTWVNPRLSTAPSGAEFNIDLAVY